MGTKQVMELFQQHRLALYNSFTAECFRFEKTFTEELARRKYYISKPDGVPLPGDLWCFRDGGADAKSWVGEQTAEKDKDAIRAHIESLQERASRAEILQQENDELQAKLETAISGRQETPKLGLSSDAVNARSTYSYVGGANDQHRLKEHNESSGSTSVPREQYDALAIKYQRLSQDFATMQEAQKALIAKWKANKGTIERWKVYAHKHLEQREKKKQRPGLVSEGKHKVSEVIPLNTTVPDIHGVVTPFRSTRGAFRPQSKLAQVNAASPTATLPSRDISSVPSSGGEGPTQGVRDSSYHALGRQGATSIVQNQQPFVRYDSPQVTTTQHMDDTGLASPQLPSPLKDPTAMKAEQVEAAELLPWDPQQRLSTSSTAKAQHPSSDATTDEGHQGSPYELPALRPDVGEDGDQVLFPQLSSDPPVIVSERSLKRKRPASERQAIKADEESRPAGYGSAVKPIRVKSEQDSSSPIGAGSQGWQEGAESLDLDEVGNRVNTPRKRRRFQNSTSASPRQARINRQITIRPDQPAANPADPDDLTPENSVKALENDRTNLRERSLKDQVPNTEKTPSNKGLSVELLNAKLESARKGDDTAMSFIASLAPAERDAILQESLRAMGAEFPKWAHNGRLQLAEHFSKLHNPRRALDVRVSTASEDDGSRDLPSSVAASSGSEYPSLETLAAQYKSKSDYARQDAASPSKVALHPRDLNTKVLPRTSEMSSKEKPRPRKGYNTVSAKIPAVAEDGEGYYANRRPKPTSSLGSSTKENAQHDNQSNNQSNNQSTTDYKVGTHQRLGNLLEEPSPEKHVLPRGARPANVQSSHSRTVSKDSPKVQTAVRGGNTSRTSNAAPSTRLPAATPTTKKVPSPQRPVYPKDKANLYSHGGATRNNGKSECSELAQPDDEPFRARPLRRLGLEHFKINPSYNQGLDYAFVETVRNRDQRQCLPGCTRPECCGDKFRKLLKIGGAPTPQRPGLWDSSQLDDDQRLLEEYLGDDRGRLSTMSTEEKDELLIQAKTKQFADKHGKHRHAYERRTTPPGFWRTDMPTTQETEEDREKAKEMERRKVEERYREAMRPGGRWMFRDE